MRAASTFLLGTLLIACTRENPAYMRGSAGSLPDEGVALSDASADGAPPVDLASDRMTAEAAAPADAAVPAAPDAPADLPAPVSPRYGFETSTQGWTDLRFDYYKQPRTPVARSTTHAHEGSYALEIEIDTMNGYTTPTIGVVVNEQIPAGTPIRYWIWFPSTTSIEAVQPYVLYYRAGTAEPVWGGIDPVLSTSTLTPGTWNLVTHRVPADVDARGVVEVGMEWRTAGNQQVKVYLDAVDW